MHYSHFGYLCCTLEGLNLVNCVLCDTVHMRSLGLLNAVLTKKNFKYEKYKENTAVSKQTADCRLGCFQPTFSHSQHPLYTSLSSGCWKRPADMELPEEYTLTFAGESFLLFDNGPLEDRILLFSTDSLLRTPETSLDWFCDGTFKVVPGLFYLLFTIHAMTNGHIVPCVFALLPNKQQATYVTLIHGLNPELSTCSIMTDFEVASRNALQEVFPDVTIQGYAFTFSLRPSTERFKALDFSRSTRPTRTWTSRYAC